MEYGGKRKRAGLSLKSFKKPALNYVKKHSGGQRLDEVFSSKCKTNSGLDKLNLTSQEEIQIPISENRMKLLSLMPRFPNWDKMEPFPFNPLMKSLTGPKNEVSDKTTEIHDLNGNTVIKEPENQPGYVDLPMLGIHYFSRKIETQLITSNESDENCMETDVLKPSDIGMKPTGIAEHELGADRSKPTDLRRETVSTPNKQRKDLRKDQERSEFSSNFYSKEEETNQEYKSLLQGLGNVSRGNDKDQARQSQTNSSVVKVDVDLTDEVRYNFEFDDFNLDEFEFNAPSSSNKTNIRKTDDRSPNLTKGKSGANLKSSNVKSTSVKDKTGVGHNQSIASNSQFKNKESERRNHKFVYTKPKDRNPYNGDVCNTSVENAVLYNKEITVIPNTPPKRERQTAKGGRPMDCKAPRLQTNKSFGKSVDEKHVSKVNNIDSTSYTETQPSKFKGNPISASKDIPKLNSMYNSSRKIPQIHSNTSTRTSQNMSKVNSLDSTSYTETQANKFKGMPISESKDIPKLNSVYNSSREVSQIHTNGNTSMRTSQNTSKVNSLCKTSDKGENYTRMSTVNSLNNRSGERQYEEDSESDEKPAFASKSFSRVNNLDRKNYKGPISASTSMGRSVYESQRRSQANCSYVMTEVKGRKAMENPIYASKDISRSTTICHTTRKDQHVQAKNTTMNHAYASKGNQKLNSLFSTNGKDALVQASKFKEPSVYTSKSVKKTNSFHKTSENQRTPTKSNDHYGTWKDTDGGLGSSDDLFGDDDDDFDEILAKSFTGDFDYVPSANQVDRKSLHLIKKVGNDDEMDDLIRNLDNDMDDDLVACCDDVMSPTIQVRQKPSSSRVSGSLNKEISSKGVKRKLNIPDAQAKARRSGDCEVSFSSGLERSFKNDDCLKECPLCSKSFHSGFSQRDIVQHIAMCCGDEEVGKDDTFWEI